MNVRWSATNLTTPGGQSAIAIPAALALTGLVTIAVAYFSGSPDDSGTTMLLEIGAGVTALFGVITVLVFQRSRASATLGWDGEKLRLEVRAPGKPLAVYTGPFREEHGFEWGAVSTGHGSIRQLTLTVAVFDGADRCVLVLRELLGAIYQPPAGWMQRMVVVSRPEHVLTNSIGRTNLDALAAAITKR